MNAERFIRNATVIAPVLVAFVFRAAQAYSQGFAPTCGSVTNYTEGAVTAIFPTTGASGVFSSFNDSPKVATGHIVLSYFNSSDQRIATFNVPVAGGHPFDQNFPTPNKPWYSFHEQFVANDTSGHMLYSGDEFGGC